MPPSGVANCICTYNSHFLRNPKKPMDMEYGPTAMSYNPMGLAEPVAAARCTQTWQVTQTSLTKTDLWLAWSLAMAFSFSFSFLSRSNWVA